MSVCVVAKYFDCCSVLCALRIRWMLYVVLFFFFNWNYSRARLDVFVARKSDRIKSMCTYAQERFEFKVVASLQLISWWSSHTHKHAHAYIMWKAVVVYVSNGILIFFLYWEIKHVFMCVVVDVLHVLSIVCMRWKYFRPKIQCFHCNFGEIVQYQRITWLQTNGKCILFYCTIFVSMSNETKH